VSGLSVDVALGTYNHRRFVAEALESVLCQETQFPVRLLVADDASTDGTRDILNVYAGRYPERIECILDRKHRGMFGRRRAYQGSCGVVVQSMSRFLKETTTGLIL
jgi:glycosyltransferase involved in cell wall biosynthesis